MSTDVQPYAIGKLGGPVRLRIVTTQSEALAQRGDEEVCCLLKYLPSADVPYMITPDGSDVIPVPPTLDQLKAARWTEARILRDARMDGGCQVSTSGGPVTIDTDPDSQRKLNGAVSAALVSASIGRAFSIGWTMADNTVVELDGPTIISVAMQVMAHMNACQVRGTAIREAIEAAADEAALAGIDISSGYSSAVYPAA